ncbi:MAG: hypothetical protein JWR20_922 [Marmoricola sp.]|nr:hypothetical protein [Marmoricola sp.]
MDPVTGLALARLTLGTVSLVSPRLAARTFLLDPDTNPQLGPMTRLFGSREAALGAITLLSSGKARQQVVQLGVAVDGADAFAGLAGAVRGEVSKPAGLLLAAVAVGAVVVGVRELTD